MEEENQNTTIRPIFLAGEGCRDQSVHTKSKPKRCTAKDKGEKVPFNMEKQPCIPEANPNPKPPDTCIDLFAVLISDSLTVLI